MNHSKSAFQASRTLALDDLRDLSVGAALLGTGGGGDPYIGRLMAEQAVREFGAPNVIAIEDVPDDFHVVTAAMVGAPTVMMEKGGSGHDIEHAVRAHAEYIRKMPDAIVPVEIGGMNSMIPIVAACRLGLPLIDCDGMGRAFPEVQMVTFNVGGISATPIAVVDEHLETVIVEATTAKRAENIVRAAAIQMGLSVLFCGYAMSGKELKEHCVPRTLSLALEIGRVIQQSSHSEEPLEELLSFLRTTSEFNKCIQLFAGKVIDVRRETRRGFSVGHCKIAATGREDDELEIQFQNEYLLAKHNGNPVAMVPDLITIIDSETIEPITVENLRFGQRVRVVGIKAADIMRTKAALEVFGPAAFGLDVRHQRIEELHREINNDKVRMEP